MPSPSLLATHVLSRHGDAHATSSGLLAPLAQDLPANKLGQRDLEPTPNP